MERLLALILSVLRGQSHYRTFAAITPSSADLPVPADALYLSADDTVTFVDSEGVQTSALIAGLTFFPVRVVRVVSVTGGASVYGAYV